MRAARSASSPHRLQRRAAAFWCALVLPALAAALTFGFAPPPSHAPAFTDGPEARASATDTLLARREMAGRVFVLNLPEHIGGQPVARYTAHHAPLLSWVHGRSVVWETRGTPEGAHHFRYLAHRQGDTPPDTLTLVVTLE